MLFSRLFLTLCKFNILEASVVTCNNTFAVHREKYFTALQNGAEIFVPVSYLPVRQPPDTERFSVRFRIENNSAQINMPIFVIHNKYGANFYIMTNNSILSTVYDQKQTNISKINRESSRKIFWFHQERPIYNFTKILLFQACRMILESTTVHVEESMLIFTEGIFNESDTCRRLTEDLQEMIPLKYKEFEDEKFCICPHLEFYLNECRETYGILPIMLVLLFFTIVFLIFKCQKSIERVCKISINH